MDRRILHRKLVCKNSAPSGAAMSGNDFWTSGTGNGKFQSHFSETVMKIPFPFLGTGMRVKNSIPDFRDGNWRTVFPGIPGNGNGNGITKLGQSYQGNLGVCCPNF